MVRAILDGRKTQTRRVVKGVPSWDHYGRDIMDWGLSGIHQETYDPNNPIEGTDRWHLDVQTDVDDHSRRVIRCPCGAPGDRLWVREAHAIYDTHGQRRADGVRWGPWGGLPTSLSPDGTEIAYFREGFDRCDPGRWRPSIHMPRWASRISLRITDVRVERLNEISEADAKAEGIAWDEDTRAWRAAEGYGISGLGRVYASPVRAYVDLWEHINGSGSWDANPWVWAVSFERMTPAQQAPPSPQPSAWVRPHRFPGRKIPTGETSNG